MFIRLLFAVFFFFNFTFSCLGKSLQPLVLSPQDRILVLAPHPDDGVLGTAGVIQAALARKLPVKVVYLTNGDNNELAFLLYKKHPVLSRKKLLQMGELRQKESTAAMAQLGLPATDLIFLGYPDFGTLKILMRYWEETKPYKSMLTRTKKVPYKNSFSKDLPYVGENILYDLEKILRDFKPTKIFISHPADRNTDHQAFYLFLKVALWDLHHQVKAEVYPYIIHSEHWPKPRGLHTDLALNVPAILEKDVIPWHDFPLNADEIKQKEAAISFFKTQLAYSKPYLFSFVRQNELFGDLPAIDLSHWNKKDLDWQQLANKENIQAEAFSKEQNEEKDRKVIDTVTYARDARFLYIRFGLNFNKLTEQSRINLHLMGYRFDRGFPNMPKLRLSFNAKEPYRFVSYKRERPVFLDQVEIRREESELLVVVPLKYLGDPDMVLTSMRAREMSFHQEYTAWRVLRFNTAPSP